MVSILEKTHGTSLGSAARRVALAVAVVLLTANGNLVIAFLWGAALAQGSPEDIITKGLEALERKAKAGDPNAQYQHGTMFGDDGQAEASKWFRRAAEQGHAKAQARLGIMYDRGEGVTRDQVAALQWLTRAAESGERFAHYYLGRKYARGEGVPADKKTAQKRLRAAAEQNHAIAQYELAKILEADDLAQAKKWYRRSAEQGFVDAQFRLATLLDRVSPKQMEQIRFGLDLAGGASGKPDAKRQEQAEKMEQAMRVWEQEQAEATKWYKAAAESGHSDAQFHAGRHEADKIEALKWLYLVEFRHRETMMVDARDRFENIYGLIKQLENSLGSAKGNQATNRAEKWLALQPARDLRLNQLFDAP